MTVGTAIWEKIPYDIFKDFVADLDDRRLSAGGAGQQGSHPAQNIAELVAWLKANPDKANYPTPSPVFTLPIEHFKLKTGAPATAISYRSSNESVTSLLGGQTAFALRRDAGCRAADRLGQSPGAGRDGAGAQSRASQRADARGEPAWPTWSAETWFGCWRRPARPMPIVRKLEAACRQIAATDDFKAKMKTLAAIAVGSTAERAHGAMKPRCSDGLPWSKSRKHQVRTIIGNQTSIRLCMSDVVTAFSEESSRRSSS